MVLWKEVKCITENKGCTSKSSCCFICCRSAQFAQYMSQVLNNGYKQTCEGCDDLSTLMDEVNKKWATSSKQGVQKLLTLLPKILTVQWVADEFGVSKCAVNKAYALKNDQGILAEPVKNLGESLSEELYRK